MKLKRDHVVVYVMALFTIAFFCYLYNESFNNRQNVAKDFGITLGWITKYWDRHNSDAGSGRNIEYTYMVDSILYSREIYTMAKFSACDSDYNNKNCKGKRFRVLYSKSDPSKSLVDFRLEVQGLKELNKPEKIEGFQ